MTSVTKIWRRGKRQFVAGLAGYAVLIGIASAKRDDLSDGVLVALALAAAALASFSITAMMRASRKMGGVERQALVETTSIAFVVTMVSCITWGLLESYAEVERPSGWTVYFIGMATWGFLGLVSQFRGRNETCD